MSFCKRVGELLCLSEEGVLLIALNSHKHFRRFAGQLELCCITSVDAVPVMEKWTRPGQGLKFRMCDHFHCSVISTSTIQSTLAGICGDNAKICIIERSFPIGSHFFCVFSRGERVILLPRLKDRRLAPGVLSTFINRTSHSYCSLYHLSDMLEKTSFLEHLSRSCQLKKLLKL